MDERQTLCYQQLQTRAGRQKGHTGARTGTRDQATTAAEAACVWQVGQGQLGFSGSLRMGY